MYVVLEKRFLPMYVVFKAKSWENCEFVTLTFVLP